MNYYDEIAEGYDLLHMEEQEKKMEIIRKHIKSAPEEKLLDVGCGTGISTRAWNCQRYGIDPAEKLVEKAGKSDPEGDYSYAKAESIPFPSGFFDIVISITAAQNFDDIEKSIREIKRVGKKTFCITFLKKSQKAELIESVATCILKPNLRIEEDKDIILIRL